MKRFAGFLAVALLFAAPAALADEKLIHSERSQYRDVRVYETDGERCMCFTVSCRIGRQSCINLANPHRFALNYTRMMMAGTFLMGEPPKRILIIGLGGGSIPTALRELLPDAQIDVVEIDPAVTRVARKYFAFKDGPKLKVIEQDGRVYVKRALREGVKYDLIMLDAFDQNYIPEHMLTKDFLTEVKSLLSPSGVLVGNTFSSSELYNHESTTYAAVFGRFFNLRAANRVVIARPAGLPNADQLRARALQYQQPLRSFGVDIQEVVPMMSPVPDWDTSARVLTDQWMPANLLNR